MRKWNFMIAALMSVCLMTPSCAVIEKAREDLNTMAEPDYQSLKNNVGVAAEAAGEKLGALLSEENKMRAAELTSLLGAGIQADAFTAPDLVKFLLDQYGAMVHLTPEQIALVNDAAKLIDAAVGQIKLDINGELSPREKELLDTLLHGLFNGLTGQTETVGQVITIDGEVTPFTKVESSR